MSTEQPLDPQLIEQTRQQIRQLVAEIAELSSRSELTPDQYCAEFLPRVVSALAALGGVFWTVEGPGRINLTYQMNLQQTRLAEDDEARQKHNRLLQRVLQTGEAVLVPPQSGSGENNGEANPTDFLLILGPVRTELEVVGVVEVFQRPDSPPLAQKGYLRFLMQMCDMASDYFKSLQLRSLSDRQSLWSRLEEFTRLIHQSLDPRETAYMLANEARRLIECDRVTISVRRGRRQVIEAISGQDVVNKRSNVVRLLGNLATVVAGARENVWFCGDTSQLAPQIEDALQQYVDEAHSKTVIVIPLGRPAPPPVDEADVDRPVDPPPPVGAMIVEQIEDSRITPQLRQRVEVVAQHGAVALANAVEHNEIFLMPLWKAIGRSKVITEARMLPKTALVTGVIVVVLMMLIFAPWPYKLHARGTLEPVLRRDVFAGIDGIVDEVCVLHGQRVEAGDVLVRLRNSELKQQILEIEGQLAANQKQVATIRRELADLRMLSAQERNRLTGQLAELEARQISLTAQLAILREKEKELTVLSPISGDVVTWDVYNRLINRPVNRGQVLMRVADTSGDWELELHMSEDRMGEIALARQQVKNADPSQDLMVEYVLATDPGRTRTARVKDIYVSAEVLPEEGNVVMIKVAVDKNDFDATQLRPGATVSAKVRCGTRSMGYAWFRDLIAFIQTRVLFYLW